MRLTLVGGPTVLIEAAGWRILTDPTFDPPGRRYRFGWGTSSTKTVGPAVAAADLLPVDLVLLSHDHHADNLDVAGRQLLHEDQRVVTTRPGARRLGTSARGLRPWESLDLDARGLPTLHVTATPARHGPPLSRPVAGAVVGFVLSWPDVGGGRVWVTGDTVLFDGAREVLRRFTVDVAIVHLGGVRFPLTGRTRYSMVVADAVDLLGPDPPRVVVPVHHDGWSHFGESGPALQRAIEEAGPTLRSRVLLLSPGTATQVPPR